MSTEGIPSFWRGNSLFIPLAHIPISLCFTGFKLVFAYYYVILSLSVYLSPTFPPSLFFSIPILWIPSSLSQFSISTHPPRQSSALSIISHKRNKSETHKPASTYTWLLKRTRVNGTCPSIWKRKTGPHQTNQPNKEKFHKERMYFVFFYFGV